MMTTTMIMINKAIRRCTTTTTTSIRSIARPSHTNNISSSSFATASSQDCLGLYHHRHHHFALSTNVGTRRYKSTAVVTAAKEDNHEASSSKQQQQPPKTGASASPPPASPSKSSAATSTSSTSTFQPTPERQYQFFQNVQVTPEGVAMIRFDCPKTVNTISFQLKDEAKVLWKQDIESNNYIKAIVFLSAKPGMFIAGADIFDIQSIDNKQDLIPLIQDGLQFFQKVMRSKNVPLVCAIDGPALGGGLEWALWCDYRICTDSSKTKLGLPEVKLGLLPGFGGTQNLPALIGLQNAMDLMLTGKEVRPDKAKKMGLVDLVVSPPSLEQVAIDCAIQLANKTLKPSRKSKSLMNRFLEDTSLGRSIVWNQIQKMVQKETHGNYPAPFAIIQCVQHGLDHPTTKYQNEREQFAKLAATPQSQALIGIFDGMTQMKKHNLTGVVARPVTTVAVMGAGLMGAGIAQVTAEKGYQVLLKDRNDAAVGRGQTYMQDNWNKKLSKKRMTQYQYNRNTSNVIPLTDSMELWKRHFYKTDVIIEAVFEDLTLKRQIVTDMEAITPSHCIFATNTSAIPIRDIAHGAQRPEQIIGMHYFSPVPSMPLLEIIPHDGTDPTTIATAFDVGTKQGKTCIIVKDVAGFYVNRCLGPYLVEVSALVQDGVSLELLDASIQNFGMPVGPITLADEVGLDVSFHVAKFLSQADLGVRMQGGDVSLMEQMIAKGWLGKKSGQGFYTYGNKKSTKNDNKKIINADVKAYVQQFATRQLKLDETEIQNRIMSRVVNEAAKCLEDEIIANPVVGDIGMVFGIGFAPFRGGPFRYLDQYGVTKYVAMMNGFAETYGPQFEPCQLLKDYAAQGKKFHK